jgi:DNA polymerase-3 subunit gamma/tau
MTALTLKYRPKTWADVVGQEATTTVLQGMVRKQDVPPCLILGGTRGSGKTTTARILAGALNCLQVADGEPCGQCGSCLGVWKTNSQSVLEIDAASSGGVDDIRKLRDLALYAHDGEWRVVLLDEAHSMSKEAFNALLKTLEEPPPRTVFIMLTTEVHKIPDTIQSRGMRFEFRRITLKDIARRVKWIAVTEGIAHDNQLMVEIARHARGGMRDAVMTLDQCRITGIETAEAFRAHFGSEEVAPPIIHAALVGDLGTVTKLAGEAVNRTGDASQLVAELTQVVRDLLVVKTGGTPPCMPQSVPARKQLAQAVDVSALPRALQILWDARSRVRDDDDQLTAGQVTCILLAEALKPIPQTQQQAVVLSSGPPITPETAAPPSEPLSLADMQVLVAQQPGG